MLVGAVTALVKTLCSGNDEAEASAVLRGENVVAAAVLVLVLVIPIVELSRY